MCGLLARGGVRLGLPTVPLLMLAGIVSQPTTQLHTDDVLLVFTRPDRRGTAEKRILAVHRAGRLAHWHGDTGE